MRREQTGPTINRRQVLGTSAAVVVAGGMGAVPARWAAAWQDEAGEPVTGGILTIGQDFGPQTLDPTLTIAWASTNIEELLYTGLLRWSPAMELEPDLATGYEMPDDITYVFTLREGVTFHNGAPFSAEDVKYTFDRILDPATASPHASIYQPIGAVEVIDPLTVQFSLSEPFAPFLRYLATIPYGAIVPAGAGDELQTAPVGTGPFQFIEHQLDQAVRLERFDGYYEDGLPYLDAVTFQLLGDDTSIAAAIQSGTVNMTWLKNPIIAQATAEATQGLTSFPGVSSRYLPIRFKLTEPPFDDVRVRRALSLALDRQALADTVLGGYGAVGTFLPPSQIAGYTGDGSDLPYYTRDVERARALLAEAGHERLSIPEFKIVAANQLDVQCAQLMQAQWAEAGIDVQINPMEVGAILDDWTNGNYQMAVVGGVWTPDPNQEVQPMYSRSTMGQGQGINDPELDALIEEGIATVDEAARIDIYQQIQQLVLDQVYVIVPYVYPLRWELIYDQIQGYEVMPSNARTTVRQTWLAS
ncbi:MAG: ABC transporter substrate-binding protein [Chloroflexia bacterium]|nr:ABC transporter substrate-binding protein [Chloroflexia bacterium]